MQNTRQRILNYLKNNQQATAPEISLILDLTQANIRHHLNVLEKDGYIEVIGQTKETRRGRPTHIYMLSKAAQDNTLDELASALLKEIRDERTASQRHRKLRTIARSMAGLHPIPNKSITIQLSRAVQRLNDLNYNAHWEAHASAPQVFLGHCPFAQIINQHPEICQLDSEILRHLTGTEFIQVEKISRSQQGPMHCRFVLKQ
jgi:predicted ArsR family transcriptional regulator